MDLELLVKQITDEVLKQVGSRGESPSAASTVSVPSANGSVLVVLNSNNKHLDRIFPALRQLNARYDLIVLLSGNAVKIMSPQEITAQTGIQKIVTDTGTKQNELYNVQAVILPNLTLATLSKLANQINDSLVIDAVMNAIICCKPVYICTDFVNFLISMNPKVGPSITGSIDTLKTMGVQAISISELAGLHFGSYRSAAGETVSITEKNLSDLAAAGAGRIGSSGLESIKVPVEVAQLIDHTQLKPDVTKDQIVTLCEEAKTYNFASVCVNPGWVSLCHSILKDAPAKVCTVIGFPLGATTTAVKAAETREAVQNGADEIDMVINVGKLKAGDYEYVRNDIKAVVDSAGGKVVKVIIETSLLTDEEKVMACKLSKEANADYVKTSTGFSTGGATMADIALMRSVVGSAMGVKASGGVKTYQDAVNMIDVGATRIGASAGVAIIKGDDSGGGSGY